MAHRHTSDTPASPTCWTTCRVPFQKGVPRPPPGAGPGAAHLYVHLPFCAHRCGYCDFVTVTGHDGDHGGYVDALLGELELERGLLADEVETVFLGGGTPTFTDTALARLLAALPAAAETTVEANPETLLTPALAALLREQGVDRISLGAQSFQPHLLETLERRASPDDAAEPSAPCAAPALTTSRSTSSMASPARASPTSSSISPRRSRSSRSTSPATSWRRSRGRGSRTPTATSSGGRRKRWRTTSSASSRPSPLPATAGTRRRTSAARTTAVISAPATTSATGSAATT